MIALVWLAVAAVAAGPRTPEIPPQTRLDVRVHIDGTVAAADTVTAGVAAGVQTIWRPYGVNAVFVASTLHSPDADTALHLIVTDRLPSALGASQDGVGWIEFIAPGRPSAIVTVSATAAWNLVRRARWAGVPVGELPISVQTRFLMHALSRAAAHEIGHYLLRSPDHTRNGLMRQRFTIAELIDESLAPYRLEPSQIAGLGRKLAEARRDQPSSLGPQIRIIS